MRKSLLVVVSALSLCGPAAAAGANAEAFGAHPHGFSAQDMAAFADARIAALKAGLQLKPEQEKSWSTLETALRDVAKARAARFEERREKAPPPPEADPIGALQRRAQNMTANAGEFEKLAAAAKPLYDSLDEAQKRRFGALLKAAIEHRMHPMPGMGHPGHMGPGEFGAGPD
jgi:hypothetical protein